MIRKGYGLERNSLTPEIKRIDFAKHAPNKFRNPISFFAPSPPTPSPPRSITPSPPQIHPFFTPQAPLNHTHHPPPPTRSITSSPSRSQILWGATAGHYLHENESFLAKKWSNAKFFLSPIRSRKAAPLKNVHFSTLPKMLPLHIIEQPAKNFALPQNFAKKCDYCCKVFPGVLRDGERENSQKKSLYDRKQKPIPTPEFFVIYNGKGKYPEKKVLRLSDAYIEKQEAPCLELTVPVYNIAAIVALVAITF